jgi:hypothetical protein
MKIWIARTNDFKTGGKDSYELLKTVDVSKGSAIIKVDKPDGFFKILLEAPYNSANSWHIVPGQ